MCRACIPYPTCRCHKRVAKDGDRCTECNVKNLLGCGSMLLLSLSLAYGLVVLFGGVP